MIIRAGPTTYKILSSLASSHELKSSSPLAFSLQLRISSRGPVSGNGGRVRGERRAVGIVEIKDIKRGWIT